MKLALRGLGTVCRATALALAGILAPMRLVAAALAFAIVLTLAGVLRKLLLRAATITPATAEELAVACDWPDTGLGVEARGRAAEEAGESGGQSEVAYCMVFMKSSFLRLVQAIRLELGFDPLQVAGKRWVSQPGSCSSQAARLKLQSAVGYRLPIKALERNCGRPNNSALML